MTLRLLTAADVEEYRALLLRSLKEEPGAFLHDYHDALQWPLQRFSDPLEQGWMAGAFVGNALVGFAGLTRYKGRKIKHKANLGPVYVTPEVRGQGMAAKMMALLEGMARNEGIERLLLSTDVTNEITQHLYKRLGFEPWGVEKHILKLADGSYVDDVVMTKSLV